MDGVESKSQNEDTAFGRGDRSVAPWIDRVVGVPGDMAILT